jgi:tetratricopeptide (TPR) repeat protein
MAAELNHIRMRPAAAEARRLAELARASGLGDDPAAAVELNRQLLDVLAPSEQTPLRADVLRWQGSALLQRGQPADAEPLYRRSLQLADALGYDPGRAHGLNCLALVSQRRGDLSNAVALFRAASAVAERCDDRRLLAMIHQNLGMLAEGRDERMTARTHFRSSLRLFESTNDREGMTWALYSLAIVDVADGRLEEADGAYDRALALARERGDLYAEGIIEENRGDLRIQLEDLHAGAAAVERALAVAEQRQDPTRRAAALRLRGAIERRRGDFVKSLETLRLAVSLSEGTSDVRLRGEILFELGESLAASSDQRSARDVWMTALDAFERIGAKAWITRVRARLGVGDRFEPS